MPRTLIEPHKGDKRYVGRSESGQFTEKQVSEELVGGCWRFKSKTL